MSTKYLILTSENGYEFLETGKTTIDRNNVVPMDTTTRNALDIPVGSIPVIYNSDTTAFEIKIGDVWYKLATTAYADNLVVGLWDDRGNYDASVNTFPATGGSGDAGAIMKGDIWTASVGGTLGGVTVVIGDTIRALINTPGQILANWAISQTNLGYTPENSANKDTDGTLAANSDTKYPSQKAVKTYADLRELLTNKATNFTVLNNTLYPTVFAVNTQITTRQTENGILSNVIADIGTDADMLEKILKSYTLSGGILAENGSYIEVEATLSTADNANAKTVTLYFGDTLIGVITATVMTAQTIIINAKIMRTAPGGQLCTCNMTVAKAAGFQAMFSKIVAASKTLADPQIIKITGQNGVATANDIVAKNMIIKNYVYVAV